MNNEPCTQTTIDRVLTDLNKTTSALLEIVDHLETRLGPVLRERGKPASSSEPIPDNYPHSSIVVRSIAEKDLLVTATVNRISGIIDLLDV